MNKDKQILLEQYKVMATTADTLFNNRFKYNTFFSILLISILGFILQYITTKQDIIITILILVITYIVIFIICRFWKNILLNCNKIMTSKFYILAKIEKELNSDCFGFGAEYRHSKVPGKSDMSIIDIHLVRSIFITITVFYSVITIITLMNIPSIKQYILQYVC